MKLVVVVGGWYLRKTKILEVGGGWYLRKSKLDEVGGGRWWLVPSKNNVT